MAFASSSNNMERIDASVDPASIIRLEAPVTFKVRLSCWRIALQRFCPTDSVRPLLRHI